MIDLSALKTDLLIGGQWVPGSSGKRIDVFDPSTGNSIATVADAAIEDGIAAIDAAEKAAEGWAATAPRQRGEILRRAFELMTARAEDLAELIARENGKSLVDARGEVAYAAEFFRWFSEEAVRLNGELAIAPGGANRILVQHQPIGISLLITPWNFPAAMATRKIGPALAAGCTCILKPATETPLTAYAMAEILAEAGVPDGVVNVVTTSQTSRLVSAMLHDPRLRKLSFTGSTEVGRILLKQAADQVISCSMELGGNAPFLVFEDADIDRAVEGAMIAKMRNGGEACTAANRFYVHESIAEAFAEQLASRMGALTMGAGYDDKTLLGPLINAESRDRIAALIEDASGKGAKILVGGEAPAGDGYFYQATVLYDVPADAKLIHEEIFGPVAPIMTFATEAEAISLANQTEYGLVAYVFTSDLARGLRVSEKIEVGMVALNRGLVSDPAAPFGGTKQSGLGREGGHHGIVEFTETKYIAAAW
jgi:succinate-semialdehyde dehydrogenase/glutarate-semialdehyde dehydrogenase